MVGQVVRHEGGDEVVAVVVARMPPQAQGMACFLASSLQNLRIELLGQKLVRLALVDQQRQTLLGLFHQFAGVVGRPGAAILTEISGEGLLAPGTA